MAAEPLREQKTMRYESMEFEPFHNRQKLQYMRATFDFKSIGKFITPSRARALIQWILTFVIGVLTAFSALFACGLALPDLVKVARKCPELEGNCFAVALKAHRDRMASCKAIKK